MYGAPKLLNRNIILRELAGGWNISTRFTARSSTPVNVVSGADYALTGTPNQRPNVNGNPILPSDRSLSEKLAQWFDSTVFSKPANGTFGNLGRNALLGPGQNSLNAAMLKNFPFTHSNRRYVQFRMEAFSLFNHPIFSNPGNSLASNLGKITSASGDRQLQMALKVVF